MGLVSQVFDRRRPGAPGRLRGDRPHALLHDRLEPRRERPAAGRPERPRAAGARAQRQPDQHRHAQRRDGAPRDHADLHHGLRDPRAPLRPRRGRHWLERIRHTLPRLGGAFCLTMLTSDALYAVRDPLGIRPLCLGRLDGGGWVVASESCALDTIGAQFIREVDPGELLKIDELGVHTERFATAPEATAGGERFGTPVTLPMVGFPQRAACSFEHIYFARPDSIDRRQAGLLGPRADGRDPGARAPGRRRPRDRRAGRRRSRPRSGTPRRPGSRSARGSSRTATSGGRSSSRARASAAATSR